jgi:DNA-binding NarL/FixJ family response regulator
VATVRERGSCQGRLERLSGSSLDCETIRRETIVELQRVIGFDRWCWPLADPDSLIPLGAVADHDYGSAVPRALELEYSSDALASKHVLGGGPNSAATLSAETRGDLARSPRWDEAMRPVGIGDVAVAACRDALGCWGWIEAYRDSADRPFEEQDLELLTKIGPSLGSALRHSLVQEYGGGLAAPSPAGVIVLDAELRVVSMTASARAWIEAMPSARVYAAFGMLPAMVYPAAAIARSRNTAAGPHALEQAVDGRWVMIEAAPLEGRAEEQIAVTFRDATPNETFDRLCRICAFSHREREVVAALLVGLDTHSIAERLFISRHTVQDHLKSVFEKTGIHSRRELLARFSTAAGGGS